MSPPQADGSVHALALIAFVGSVFSPYYAAARRWRGTAATQPEAHVAVNLSLYRRGAGQDRFSKLWCMTERGAGALQRSAHTLQIGPSRLQWQRDTLVVDVDEWAVPWPQRLRGRLTLHTAPSSRPGRAFALDAEGRHRWQPIAPCAHLEADFTHPPRRWQGAAYLDHNAGDRPLEADFHAWQWSRSHQAGGARILYDALPRHGPPTGLHLQLGPSADAPHNPPGTLCALPMPPQRPLPRSAWGLHRHTGGAGGPLPTLSLESGPFYARTLLGEPRLGTEEVVTVHESLSLDRFAQPWVQALLPFRMPRRR